MTIACIHIIRASVKPKKKRLVGLKTMAINCMSQKIQVIFYQALVLSVINYGFGILTLSAAILNGKTAKLRPSKIPLLIASVKR